MKAIILFRMSRQTMVVHVSKIIINSQTIFVLFRRKGIADPSVSIDFQPPAEPNNLQNSNADGN